MGIMDPVSSANFRRQLVEHATAVNALLSAATPSVAAAMKRTYRLDLYPLEFIKDKIAEMEAGLTEPR